MTAGDLATTCKRELLIEVPADEVRKEVEQIVQAFQRQARVAGFRKGKTPASIVRQRFAGDIRQEVLERLAPRHFAQRVRDENLIPVAAPHIEDLKLDLEAAEPMRFKAVFEAYPEVELKELEGLEVEYDQPVVPDEEVDAELKRHQEQQATYDAVEDRPLADGDYASVSYEGYALPAGANATDLDGEARAAEWERLKTAGGKAIKGDGVMVHIGGERTLGPFNENLRGVSPGEERFFPVSYPEDAADTDLAGRAVLYKVRVDGVKAKQLPELNDDLARDLGEFETLDQVRDHIRNGLREQKEYLSERDAKDRLSERLVEMHPVPVPESLVEQQFRQRVERAAQQLARRRYDPNKMDWVKLREAQRQGAERDVRLGLILDAVARRENIEVSEEEVQRELERYLRGVRPRDQAAARARLTKGGAADTIKDRLRTEKALEAVYRKANRVPGHAGTEVTP